MIDKQNGNYGSCINAALPVAQGKYIKVPDADDWFSGNFQSFISFLSDVDVDLVMSDFDFVLDDGRVTIIFLNMRKALDDSGLSVSEVTGKTQSLMCFRNKHGGILIETPNKKVKAYYKLIGETIPASLKIKDFRRKVMLS